MTQENAATLGATAPRAGREGFSRRRAAADAVLRYFFGRDIFISYARADAVRYAPELANRIRARLPKVSVYVDQWVAPPDAELPASLVRAVRWSSILVLVGTEQALRSRFVHEELSAFAPTHRPVIPIEVGNVDLVQRWPALESAVRERESPEAVEAGEPSEAVVTRIARSVEFTTREERIELAVRATLAFIVALLLTAALVSTITIRNARAAADATTDSANAKQITAFRETKRQKALAAAAESQATTARNDAKAATQLRDDAITEAGRQREIAELRRRLGLAETLAVAGQRELVTNPVRVPRAARLFGSAYRIAPSANYEHALRAALRLLAPRIGGGTIAERFDAIVAGRISSDGRAFGVVSRDGRRSTFAAEDGALVDTTPAPHDGERAIVNPAGTAYAVRVGEGTFEVRDVATGERIGAPHVLAGDSRVVALSRSGATVAARTDTSFYPTVFVHAGEKVSGPWTAPEEIRVEPRFAVSDDGRYVAMAGPSRPLAGGAPVWLWDAQAGGEPQVLRFPDIVRMLDFHGVRLVVTTTQSVHIWDTGAQRELRQVRDDRTSIDSAIVSSSGRFLAIVSEEPFVRIVDTGSGLDVAIVEQAGLRGLAFSDGEDRLLTWGAVMKPDRLEVEAVWSLWDIGRSGGWDSGLASRPGGVTTLPMTPRLGGGNVLLFEPSIPRLVVSYYSQLWLFDRLRPNGIVVAPLHAAAAAVDRERDVVRVMGYDGALSVWRAGGSDPIRRHDAFPDTMQNGRSVGDGGRLVAWHAPGLRDTIHVADFHTGAAVRSIQAERMVSVVRLAASAPILAFQRRPFGRSSAITEIRVIDVSSGATIGGVDRADPVTSIALSPDGSLLAISTIDGVILHDVRRSTEIARYTASRQAGQAAFAPDGRFLAVASGGAGTSTAIHVWDVRRGAIVASLPYAGTFGANRFDELHFDATGEWVWINRPEPGLPWFWRWNRDALIPSLCGLRLPVLTVAEWNDAVGSDEPFRPLCKQQ